MTWNVARGGVAVATDTSEVYAVSAAVGLGELCAAVSIGGELVVADSAVGVSVAPGRGRVFVPVSIGGRLRAGDFAVGGSGEAGSSGGSGDGFVPRPVHAGSPRADGRG